MSNEQRTDEWFNSRMGRFTGSRMSDIMAGGTRKMTESELAQAKIDKNKRKTIDTLFGDGAKTYIAEVANEMVFGRNLEEQYTSPAMQRGIELEPKAFKKLGELLQKDFITIEECGFFTDGDNIGASPDGLAGLKGNIEIKCPDPDKIFKMILEGEDCKIEKNYIVQMQTEMLVTNTDHTYFFNYGIYNGKEIHHLRIIKRDETIITEIKERCEEAAKIRDEYINKLQNNKQF
jgi:predicted phage-related endonuclease